MPSFGRTPLSVPGIGPLLPHTEETVNNFRQRERSRSTPRPRAKSIRDFSRARSVYVYNIGPFPGIIDANSYGPMYIAPLGVEKAKKNIAGVEFNVSKPLVIEGNPAEAYPGEGRGIWIEHEPAEHLGYSDNPGLHFALTILGGGPQQLQGDFDALGLPVINLTKRGLFVSEIPEQSEPAKILRPTIKDSASLTQREKYERELTEYEAKKRVYDEEFELFSRWRTSYSECRDKFIGWLALKCEEANQAFASAQFGLIRDQLYFIAADLLNKTVIDCPFLGATVANSQRKLCIECGATMQSDKIRCPACHVLQISDAEYQAILAQRNTPQPAA